MEKISPNNLKEAEDLAFYIFLQGDMRNFDDFYLNLVADFILNKAIIVHKEIFPIKENKEINKEDIYGPQKDEKYNALSIIKIKNLEFLKLINLLNKSS